MYSACPCSCMFMHVCAHLCMLVHACACLCDARKAVQDRLMAERKALCKESMEKVCYM